MRMRSVICCLIHDCNTTHYVRHCILPTQAFESSPTWARFILSSDGSIRHSILQIETHGLKCDWANIPIEAPFGEISVEFLGIARVLVQWLSSHLARMAVLYIIGHTDQLTSCHHCFTGRRNLTHSLMAGLTDVSAGK